MYGKELFDRPVLMIAQLHEKSDKVDQRLEGQTTRRVDRMIEPFDPQVVC